MSESFASILVDTSTLVELKLHDPEALSGLNRHNAAAIEALVLFERVYLDGRTTDTEMAPMRWLDELDDGIEKVNTDYSDVRATYDRGLLIARQTAGLQTVALNSLSEAPATRVVLQELGVAPRYIDRASSTRYATRDDRLWDDLEPYLSGGIGGPASGFIDHLVQAIHPASPGTVMMLARLGYYLALQERLGSFLLLHPDKAYDTPVAYGYANTILDVFDERVRQAYLERQRKWLGETTRQLPMPLLARYVLKEAEQHGWSLGRTISWMRTQPEVRLFRQGMQELVARFESQDNAGTDAILSELEAAAQAWSTRLGSKIGTRKVSLQVAIPIISPTIDVPLPKFRRTPADKLLVLIDKLLA